MSGHFSNNMILPCDKCMHERVCKDKIAAERLFKSLAKMSPWDNDMTPAYLPEGIKLTIICKNIKGDNK